MKTREIFDEIRNRKKEYITIRVRMVLAVLGELVFCALLAFLLDMFIRWLFPWWKFPFIAELIIVSVVVGTITTAFVAKVFFMPMKKLRQGMDKVADGDFSVRLDPEESSLGEVKELYAGFNLMANELNGTEVLQTDFVSNVSHEIKTPINAIEGYAMLLQDEDGLSEDQRKEYVDKILLNTGKLSDLVGNILLLSRLDNQLSQPVKSKYRLDEQIRQSLLMFENQWSEKNLELDVDMEDVEYNGYENLMQHVWTNLIGNGIKFNKTNGYLRIKLYRQGNSLVFTVEDSGEGISDEALRHIFDKFYQGDTSHKQEGNGLGLALVKKIVTLSGGTISAENAEAGGCRFTVTLPE